MLNVKRHIFIFMRVDLYTYADVRIFFSRNSALLLADIFLQQVTHKQVNWSTLKKDDDNLIRNPSYSLKVFRKI